MKLPKYILIEKKPGELELIFGFVEFHFELLPKDCPDKNCKGGGFWRFNPKEKQIILYGRSTDYGSPDKKLLNKVINDFYDFSDLEMLCWIAYRTKETDDIDNEFWNFNDYKIIADY